MVIFFIINIPLEIKRLIPCRKDFKMSPYAILRSVTLRTGCMAAAILMFIIVIAGPSAGAETVEYSLTIAEQKVNYSGKTALAVTINGGIPGPVLRFQEGALARIHVHNKLTVPTSIHWHGILVPPGMDGVPYISFPPIPAGTSFIYEFPIRQAGTYWYHAHSELQEQRGLYGAIVIEPKHRHGHPHVHTDRDHTVVLSDWTDEDPHSVLHTLKRGTDWYSIEKGSAHSLLGAARLGALGDYFSSMLMRMPPMDISDVAYDRFLANGRSETWIDAKPGETVRVRIIDGSATTYFHMEYAGGQMAVVSADGQDVEPVKLDRLLIAVAETYDVIVHVPAAGAYELRATAHDGSAFTSIWIGSGDQHPAPTIPRPNIYKAMGKPNIAQIFAFTPAGTMGMPDRDVDAGMFDQPGMMHKHHGEAAPSQGTHKIDHGSIKASNAPKGGGNHAHHGHDTTVDQDTSMMAKNTQLMTLDKSPYNGRRFGTNFGLFAADASSAESLAVEGGKARPWAPYDRLRSIGSTTFASGKPIREIRLTLDGDMERYVWFLNNRVLSETDDILIRQGEIVRFIMINRTMMHHPMHLHGHFFRVINGQGDRAPLKHTVDVAPMSTTVIEFDANEFGDWFFHCHLLYHMHSGMARLIHYEGYRPDPSTAVVRPKLYEESWYFHGEVEVLSNMTEGSLTLSNTRNIFRAEWEAGWQDVDEMQWEGILTWNRYMNGFFSLFVGADFVGIEDDMEKVRGIFGFRYRLPLDVDFRAWVDTDRGGRLAFDKHIELIPRLQLIGHAEYDTHHNWEGRVGLSYMLTKNVSITVQWHSEYNWGAGAGIKF
jgi:hypothetical protein